MNVIIIIIPFNSWAQKPVIQATPGHKINGYKENKDAHSTSNTMYAVAEWVLDNYVHKFCTQHLWPASVHVKFGKSQDIHFADLYR